MPHRSVARRPSYYPTIAAAGGYVAEKAFHALKRHVTANHYYSNTGVRTKKHKTSHPKSKFKETRSTIANTSNLYTPGLKRSRKVLKNRKSKYAKVHVSKSLSQKIHKVVDNKEIQSTMTNRYFGDTLPIINKLIRAVGVQGEGHDSNRISWYAGFSERLATSTLGAGADASPQSSYWSFTAGQFLNVASIMFNGKTANNFATELNPNGALMFDYKDIKFTVKNCSTTYNIKNNSTQTINIIIYQCAPKVSGPWNYHEPNTQANLINNLAVPGGASGIGSTVSSSILDPVQMMKHAYDVDILNNQLRMNVDSQWDDASETTGIYISPKLFRGWTQKYSADKINIALQPGQTYSYVMQGPKDWTYDGKNHFKDEIWCPLRTVSRMPLVGIWSELGTLNSFTGSTLTDSYSARGKPYINVNQEIANRLCCERIDKYTIAMPEQAGFLSSGLAQVENLDHRHSTTSAFTYVYNPQQTATEPDVNLDYDDHDFNPIAPVDGRSPSS